MFKCHVLDIAHFNDPFPPFPFFTPFPSELFLSTMSFNDYILVVKIGA